MNGLHTARPSGVHAASARTSARASSRGVGDGIDTEALARQGMAAYGLSLWDAHMWAYAEVHELGVLYSEDFQHERWYGSVLVLDPFVAEGTGSGSV